MKKYLYTIWFVLATTLIIILSIIAKSAISQVVASVCGVIYVLGVAKENRYSQLFGIANTAIYGVIMLKSGLYGSAAYNLIYCIPMLIYTFIFWGKKKQNDLKITRFSNEKRAGIMIIIVFLITVYYYIAMRLKVNYALVDAVTIVTGILGMYIIAKKKVEQWYCWIAVNVANGSLWIIKTVQDFSNITMVIMWSIYLINNCYGLYIWNKKLKEDKNSI